MHIAYLYIYLSVNCVYIHIHIYICMYMYLSLCSGHVVDMAKHAGRLLLKSPQRGQESSRIGIGPGRYKQPSPSRETSLGVPSKAEEPGSHMAGPVVPKKAFLHVQTLMA